MTGVRVRAGDVSDDRFHLLSDAVSQLTRGEGIKLWRNRGSDRLAWFMEFRFLKMKSPLRRGAPKTASVKRMARLLTPSRVILIVPSKGIVEPWSSSGSFQSRRRQADCAGIAGEHPKADHSLFCFPAGS